MKQSNVKRTISLIVLILLIIASIILVNYNKKDNKAKEDLKNIEISVYDKEEKLIYEKKVETEEMKLLEALNKIDDLKIETQSSQYGEFITSINDTKQEENYFWNYYVNDEYATVGVTEYDIKDKDNFKFILEKF